MRYTYGTHMESRFRSHSGQPRQVLKCCNGSAVVARRTLGRGLDQAAVAAAMATFVAYCEDSIAPLLAPRPVVYVSIMPAWQL